MSDLDPRVQQFFDRHAALISVPERKAARPGTFPVWRAVAAAALAIALVAAGDVVLQANALAESEGASCASLLQKVDAYFAANGKKPVSAQPADVSSAFADLKARCGKSETTAAPQPIKPSPTTPAVPKAP